MPRTLTSALLVIGVVLLVGTPLLWYSNQPEPVAGELPAALTVDEAAPPAPTTDPPSSTTAGPSETSEDDGVTAPAPPATSDGLQGPLGEDERISPPVGISLPGIGVEGATVTDVGLDTAGAVAIPDDVREVGWYRRGPRPGEPGNAFMTSHVDSRTQGRGVLFDLRRSEPGQTIVVDHADGSQTEWEIVRRERITKGSYPLDQVFRFDGEPGLVIDTCGGAFNASTGSYESIDIVYAVPAAN